MDLRARGLRLPAIAAFVLTATLATMSAAAYALDDDRGAADAALREIDASPRRDAARELVARAKDALARGARMRAGGDEAHAKLAEGAARTWAEAGRDLTAAATVEERAAAARRGAADAGAFAERERSLLEESIAESGRLRAQLDGVERESKEQPARTNAAGATSDAGAKPTPATKRAAADGPSTEAKVPPPKRMTGDGGAR